MTTIRTLKAPQNFSRIASRIAPWKRLDVILSTALLNIFSCAIPLLVFHVYDRVILDESHSALWGLFIGSLIVIALDAILRFSRSRLLTWIGVHYEYAGTVSAFWNFMQGCDAEDVENIEHASVVKDFMAGNGFLALIDLPFVFLFLGVISCFSLPIGLTCGSLIALFMTMCFFSGKALRPLLEKQRNFDADRHDFVTEIFQNHHTLKALGMEDIMQRRYENLQYDSGQLQYRINVASESARHLGSRFSYTLLLAVFSLSAWSVMHESMTLGMMGAMIVLSARLLQPIQGIIAMWTRLQQFFIAQQKLQTHFDGVQEKFRLMPPISQEAASKKSPITQGQLILDQVIFHYRETHKSIFQKLSLRVEPGEMITIHGKNGVGKTTLMHLITGALTPDEGDIQIDGVPLHLINPQHFHQDVVYLPSKGVLFQASIIDNITFFRRGEYAEEAKTLSVQLGLDEWVQRLPLGYDTKVGDDLYLSLPDGIRQRICLVRALLQNPKILIFDEANACLDEHGDALFQGVLARLKGHVTIVFVTHCPSLHKMADHCYELKNGYLIEQISEDFSSGNIFSKRDVSSEIYEIHETKGRKAYSFIN